MFLKVTLCLEVTNRRNDSRDDWIRTSDLTPPDAHSCGLSYIPIDFRKGTIFSSISHKFFGDALKKGMGVLALGACLGSASVNVWVCSMKIDSGSMFWRSTGLRFGGVWDYDFVEYGTSFGGVPYFIFSKSLYSKEMGFFFLIL